MKRILLFIVVVITNLSGFSNENTKNIVLNFSKSEFVFSYNEASELEISSTKHIVTYEENYSEPGLPLIPVNILIPQNCTYKNLSFTKHLSNLYHNVNISANPIPYPTNATFPTPLLNTSSYSNDIYPQSNVQYVGTSEMDGFTILRFLVCPFVYDNQNKSLSITDTIALNIQLAKNERLNAIEASSPYLRSNMANIVKEQIIDSTINDDFDTQSGFYGEDRLEYVVITSPELINYFRPLIKWKRIKGIRAAAVTLETAYGEYPNDRPQLALKKYLYKLYKERGLKYVLLGGDYTVVPVQGCFGFTVSVIRNDIPTDLYYACFGGNFDWNANGNERYGETRDSISMDPSIFVTRVPVRTQNEVTAFVTKIVNYEMFPTKGGWDNTFLSVGNKLADYLDDGKSDAEVKGDSLYYKYIATHWTGKRKKFCDTYTDLEEGNNYTLNASHLQEQLQKRYNFVDVITHGYPYDWALKEGTYNINNARELTAKENSHTIITTTACMTNAFDHFVDEEGNEFDNCLSRAFITNEKSGVIAYLGTSRENVDYYGEKLGPCLKYEAQFYKRVFSSNAKAFGEIVTAAKQALVNSCKYNNYYRWVQFALNPIGDPEMPVYSSCPTDIQRCRVSYYCNYKGRFCADVIFGFSGDYTVTAMSSEDDGASYYKVIKTTQKATFEGFSRDMTICVTSPGCIPKIFQYKYPSVTRSKIERCEMNDNQQLFISAQIADDKEDAIIQITSDKGVRKRVLNVSANGNTITENISDFSKGIHIVSLLIDGKTVDTINFIKK